MDFAVPQCVAFNYSVRVMPLFGEGLRKNRPRSFYGWWRNNDVKATALSEQAEAR